jgi:hypothetical protein
MAEKSGKGSKPKGGGTDDPGVLASLPSTRPARLSRRGRDGGGAPAKPRAKAAAKPKPAAKRPAKPKAAKPKAAKPKAEPTPIVAAAEKQRPTAVRAGHPTLATPPAGPPADAGGQSGIDLVKTVVQAAGEVAQIGATVGGQILRRAVDKLPKRP